MIHVKLLAEIEHLITGEDSRPGNIIMESRTMCIDLLTIALFWDAGLYRLGGKDHPTTEIELIAGSRFRLMIAYKDLLQAMLDGGLSVDKSL